MQIRFGSVKLSSVQSRRCEWTYSSTGILYSCAQIIAYFI